MVVFTTHLLIAVFPLLKRILTSFLLPLHGSREDENRVSLVLQSFSFVLERVEDSLENDRIIAPCKLFHISFFSCGLKTSWYGVADSDK